MGVSNLRSKAERCGLINALSAVPAVSRAGGVRRFLEGLSRDELAYIAAFVGAGVLDPELAAAADRDQAARQIERYEACRLTKLACDCAPGAERCLPAALRTDSQTAHRMILLLEYLSRASLAPERAWVSSAARA